MVKIREIKPGSHVIMNTKKGEIDCIILESPAPDVILVKLSSGYNVGIMEEDIINIVVKHEKSEEYKKENKGKEILLKPVLPITQAKGMLNGMEKKPTRVVIKEVKKGWK